MESLWYIHWKSTPIMSAASVIYLHAPGKPKKQHLLVFNKIYLILINYLIRFVNIANACPDLFSQTVVLNGVSKAYSMTGWRIGYCGGPTDIITAMENIQSQSTSNPSSISYQLPDTGCSCRNITMDRWQRRGYRV